MFYLLLFGYIYFNSMTKMSLKICRLNCSSGTESTNAGNSTDISRRGGQRVARSFNIPFDNKYTRKYKYRVLFVLIKSKQPFKCFLCFTCGHNCIQVSNVTFCQPKNLDFGQLPIEGFGWYQTPKMAKRRVHTAYNKIT